MKAIFDKCTSKAIITKYSKLLDSVSGSFVTNMKMSRMTSLIKFQLTNNYEWNLVTNSLNGSDSSNYTYSAPSTKAYVMEPTEESVEFAIDLINQVLEGKILDKETVSADASNANRVTQESTTTNKTTDTKEEEDKEEETTSSEKTGLAIKLGKNSIEFYQGEEFIYYGYTATYDGEEIKSTSSIEETFSIKDKTYDNYQDLVFYISNYLDPGTYTIHYTITYKGESAIATQEVTIKESLFEEEPDTNEPEEENQQEEVTIEPDQESNSNSKEEDNSFR